MKTISIIVPFFNEEESLNNYFKELFITINKIKKYIFEIVCVDDGSKDNTLVLLKKEANKHKEIKVVSFTRNFGHEAAINAGINNCTGEAAVIMDADLQDPPSLIPELLKKYELGFEVVNVKRVDRSSDSFFKRFTAKMFYKLISKWSYKVKIEENVNNFRLISKNVIKIIQNLSEKNKVFRFEIPFAGFKSTYIEMARPIRTNGKSHYNLKSMNKLAIDSIISVSIEPLNLIYKLFIFGLILTSISIVTEIVLFSICKCTPLLSISNISFLAWLIVNVLLILSTIIMLSLAIIAQYIARIHIETQNRPSYIIESIYKNK